MKNVIIELAKAEHERLIKTNYDDKVGLLLVRVLYGDNHLIKISREEHDVYTMLLDIYKTKERVNISRG